MNDEEQLRRLLEASRRPQPPFLARVAIAGIAVGLQVVQIIATGYFLHIGWNWLQ